MHKQAVTCPATPSQLQDRLSWGSRVGGGSTFLKSLSGRRGPGQQLRVQAVDLSVLTEHQLLEAADLHL